MHQRTRPIRADLYWNDTAVHVTKGTRYRARLVPGMGEPLRDASFEASGIQGEDWESLPHKAASLFHGRRIDDAKWFALIATVDRSHPWVVADGAVFTAPADGQLVCYFNDVQLELFYRNNTGWVVLDVEEVSADEAPAAGA